MKFFRSTGIFGLPLLAVFVGVSCSEATAQVPVVPVVAAVPAIISVIKKPKAPSGLVKFEGYVTNANIAQMTLRDKSNETSLQTFSLSQDASIKMQQVIDNGGYQYGDKVRIYYDPSNRQVMKFKGKPSKPI